MARTSKTTKSKKKVTTNNGDNGNNNDNSNIDTMTENEAAMDSLDIDLLFGGGDDGVGDGLFDDNLLDFGDVGMEDLGAITNTGSMTITGSLNTGDGGGGGSGIKTSKGPPPLPPTMGRSASTSSSGMGGINTDYNATITSNKKKQKSKKKKKSKSIMNADDASKNDSSNLSLDKTAAISTSTSTITKPLKTRPKSKRKKKPTTIYSDTDESKPSPNKNLSKKGKQVKQGHAHDSLPSSSTMANGAIAMNMPLASPLSSKSRLPSSLLTKTATSSFPTSSNGVSTSTSSINAGTHNNSTQSRKTGKIQRFLPTQRKRKISSESTSSSHVHDISISNKKNTEIKESIPKRPLHAGSSLPMNGHGTNIHMHQGSNSHIVIGKSTTSSSSSKKRQRTTTNTFFPFSSIPPSCLGGGGVGIGQNQLKKFPNLYQIYKSSISAKVQNKSLPSSHNTIDKHNLLLQLIAELNRGSRGAGDAGNGKNSKHGKKQDKASKTQVNAKIDEQSIALSKKYILTANKKSLTTELKQLLAIVNKQKRYLTKSLVHMSTWCNNTYTPIDSLSAASSNTSSLKKQNKSSSFSSSSQNNTSKKNSSQLKLQPSFSSLASNSAFTAGVSPVVIHYILNAPHPQPQSSLKSTVAISVKIKCTNLKKQDTNRNLQAMVPPNSIMGISTFLANHMNLSTKIIKNPSTKKRKIANSTIVATAIASAKSATTSNNNKSEIDSTAANAIVGNKTNSSSASSLVAPRKKQYVFMNPEEKLNLIKNILSQRATIVKQEMHKHNFHSEAKSLQIRDKERHKLIALNDEHVFMNTATLWGIMKNQPYWDNLVKSNVSSALSILWHPEVSDREIHRGDNITPRILAEKQNEEKKNEVNSTKIKSDEDIQVSSFSLFDRLQSLLVEENGSDDDEDDESDISDEDSDNDCIIDLDEDTCDEETDNILDVSELSLDQRAYIHLRAIHLIDQPLLPTSHPKVIEENISNSNNEEKDDRILGGMDIDDNDNLNVRIRQMQFELSNQHRKNNAIAASLKERADEELNQSMHKRKRAEEESSYIFKYSQLVTKAKKKKEETTKLRQRHNGFEQWVPW